MLPEIWGKTFKQFSLCVRDKRGLAAFGTAHEERDDKASGFAAARCADAEQVIIVPSDHPVRCVERVSVWVIRMLFDFSEDHALRLARGREFQKFAHFLLRQETGRAMRTVRENVKPTRVVRVFVAGEPDVALFRDEADNQHNYQRRYDPKASEHCTPVFERVQHPDAFYFFFARVKGRSDSKPQGIEKHPIKIPADNDGWYAHGQFSFVSGKPAFEFCFRFVLQLFKEL